jgi:hypothetical protein
MEPEPQHGEVQETLTREIPLDLLWPLAVACYAREGLGLRAALEQAADEILEVQGDAWEKRDGKREYPDEDRPGHWTPFASFNLGARSLSVRKYRRWSAD